MTTFSGIKPGYVASDSKPSRTHSLSYERQQSQEKPLYMGKASCRLSEVPDLDFPFKPQIGQLPYSLYKDRSKIQISKEEQIQRLIDNRRDQQERRLRDRLKKEQEEIQEHCTFQPVASSGEGNSLDGQVHLRLYQQGVDRLRHRQLSRSQQKQNYSFQPNLHRSNILNTQKTNLQPLYLRLAEQIRKQHDYRVQLKKNVIEQELEECQPVRLNPRSAEIIEKKDDFCRNVVDRLMREVKDREFRRQQMIENQEVHDRQVLTFKPDINPVSIGLTEALREDFLQRQQTLAEDLRNKMQQRTRELLREENVTFKPTINKVSELLANMQRMHQDHTDRIERLHQESEISKRVHLQQIQSESYKQCTFQPQINQISKLLEANPVQHCCDRPQTEQYNFRPEINSKSRQMARNSTRKTENSDLQVQKIKMQLEYNKMKECTFKPKIKSYITRSQKSLSDIGGINSFLRVAQNRNKKQQEHKDIQQKLFKLQKRYDQRPEKLTKVEEFNLSKPNSKIKQELKEQQIKQLAKQCPFKPATNKTRERTIVHRIIY